MTFENLIKYAREGVENELDRVEKLYEAADLLGSEDMMDFYDHKINALENDLITINWWASVKPEDRFNALEVLV